VRGNPERDPQVRAGTFLMLFVDPMAGDDVKRPRYALSDKFSGQCTLSQGYNEVSIGIKTSQFINSQWLC
jgi:hypothetical protein